MSVDLDKNLMTAERKTRELCGHERDGLRCIRAKGHDHDHAAYTPSDYVMWRASAR